jgi:antirestriction protein ArdC
MKRDLYQTVTDGIVAQLEQGVMPWVKGWEAGSALPMNASTNRPYSGINVLLFWVARDQNWASPRFLTYNQAGDLGGHVRKGEHGHKVYYFRQLEVADRANPDESRTIPMLREYTVFNVSQCDGLPDHVVRGPDAGRINADNRQALADDFIRSTGADFREGAGAPCYVPSKDFITVPGFADFHSMPEYYAAAFHELVHWTGHKARLDRDLKTRFDRDAYAVEELIAELGAAFLCAEFGLDNAHANQAAYLDHWLSVLKADKRAIFTAASKAQKAADYLRGLAIAEPLHAAA